MGTCNHGLGHALNADPAVPIPTTGGENESGASPVGPGGGVPTAMQVFWIRTRKDLRQSLGGVKTNIIVSKDDTDL